MSHFLIIFFIVTISILCFVQSEDNYHECARPCTSDVSSSMKCIYRFFVTSSFSTTSFCRDNTERRNDLSPLYFLAINGTSPGPSIEVCLGDTIEIYVYNKLGSDELSFHWHGIRQKDYNYMDGVPMITQCPILPFSTYRYKVYPENAGTYFYHAHSVSQQADGVYGSFIVRGPKDDLTLERIFLLSSRSQTPLTWYSHLYSPTPAGLLVNGQARETISNVKHGLDYLLRFINANAHDCPVLLSVHGHSLRVLAADGNPVQSMTGTHVVLFPGERLDALLTTDQAAAKYALDVRGLRDCRHLHHEAYILYDEAMRMDTVIRNTNIEFDPESLKIIEGGHNCHRISKNIICSLDLKSDERLLQQETADETIYIPYDTNTFSFFTDDMTDHSYNLYMRRFYPAYLSLRNGIAARIPQINGMSFKYPSSPILSQPEDTLDQSICSIDKRSEECTDTPLFCECIQIIQVPSQKIIDIILIDQGFGGNISYTFHLHGYNVSVIGRDSFGRPITKDEIISLDRDNKIVRYLVNPIQKDTFVVPNKGYIILRLFTDNLGYWLWEARNTAIYPELSGSGMQFLMRVGLHRNLLPVPIDFPSCGNNKGLDLIFETS